MTNWTPRTKPSDTWTDKPAIVPNIDYLLKEDEFFLLTENGDKIIIYRSSDYVNRTKPEIEYTDNNKPSITWETQNG